jgi:hypothetical protein
MLVFLMGGIRECICVTVSIASTKYLCLSLVSVVTGLVDMDVSISLREMSEYLLKQIYYDAIAGTNNTSFVGKKCS